MKILIMGLPGSGKTTLAEKLQKRLDCAWYNADKVRAMANDWDFGSEARLRAARRMSALADAEVAEGRVVICDFVCPTPETRNIFNADITIWMDTISSGRFDDTNAMFVAPSNTNYTFTTYPNEEDVESLIKDMMIPFKFESPKAKSWFFDLDGTLMEYNNPFRGEPDRLLPGVKELWSALGDDDMIVLTTARPSSMRDATVDFLRQSGIRYDHIIFDLPRGERIIVNDKKPEVEQTAYAWIVERNKGYV